MLSCLCIPNVVFDLSALPQFFFLISSINYEHHYQSKVILALVVKGKSRMCCGSRGKSSLFSIFDLTLFFFSIFWVVLIFGGLLQYWGSLYSWFVFIFGVTDIFSDVSIFCVFSFEELSFFLWLSWVIGSSSFLGAKQCKTGLNRIRANRTKQHQTGPNGAKQGKTGPDGIHGHT